MTNNKKRLFMVFGTRPEAIKLAPLIKSIQEDGGFELKICVTAQHRELLDGVLREFNINPQFDLSIMQEDQTLDYITCEVLRTVGELLDLCVPDIVIVQGDTTTAFASALAAFYRNIPIAHVEAGLRSGNISAPFPEEFNRRAISAISSYHFAPTSSAKAELLSEGIGADKIYTVGNTAIDALLMTKEDKIDYKILKFINDRPFFLVTVHRREHSDKELEEIFEGIKNLLEDNPRICAVYPLHKSPRVIKKATEILKDTENIFLCEPQSVKSFHSLLRKCLFVLTDSGGIQEEVTFLGKPSLVTRRVTERNEGVESGVLKLVGADGDAIYAAATLLLYDKYEYEKMTRPSLVYGDGNASRRIVEVLKRV